MSVVNHIIQVLDTCPDTTLRGAIGHAWEDEAGCYRVSLFSRPVAPRVDQVAHKDCRILIPGDNLAALASTIASTTASEVSHAD